MNEELTVEQQIELGTFEEIRVYLNMRYHLLRVTLEYAEGEERLKREGELKGIEWVDDLINLLEKERSLPNKSTPAADDVSQETD